MTEGLQNGADAFAQFWGLNRTNRRRSLELLRRDIAGDFIVEIYLVLLDHRAQKRHRPQVIKIPIPTRALRPTGEKGVVRETHSRQFDNESVIHTRPVGRAVEKRLLVSLAEQT